MTVSTGGVITGFNFVPGAAATMTSPTSVPLHLLALEQAAKPGTLGDLAAGADSAGSVASDAQLRAAIVNVAGYYLRLAQTRTPAQMEALIWDNTSSNGADHGPSCAAFASLTLELAAQAVGQQSWVSGGSSYPWPLPEWSDVRVDTNPDSPDIVSMVADSRAHGRWHPLGDGYQPRPGDWVLFSGHVEVITGYREGVLDTIGADSLPGLTVNAHSFGGSFAAHGVEGFVDNGNLKPSGTTVSGPGGGGAGATPTSAPAARATKPTSAPRRGPPSRVHAGGARHAARLDTDERAVRCGNRDHSGNRHPPGDDGDRRSGPRFSLGRDARGERDAWEWRHSRGGRDSRHRAHPRHGTDGHADRLAAARRPPRRPRRAAKRRRPRRRPRPRPRPPLRRRRLRRRRLPHPGGGTPRQAPAISRRSSASSHRARSPRSTVMACRPR